MLKKALRVSCVYLVFGAIWIIASDWIVNRYFPDVDRVQSLQTAKGLLFVAISTIVIFLAAWRELKLEHRYQLKLSAAESQLHQVAERTSDLVYTFQRQPERRFTYVSPSVLSITGYSQQDHYRDAELSYKIVHPEDRPLLDSLIEPGNEGKPFKLRWIHKSGKIIYIEVSNVALRDEHGNIVGVSGMGRDVTQAEIARQELEHLNHAYAVLWQVNKLIVNQGSVAEIYQEACAIPLSSGNFSLVWIGRVDRAANRLDLACSSGDKIGYLDGLNVTLDDTPTGRGPSGLAARMGKAYWSTDIATDDSMAPWRARALSNGFRSSAAFPLKVDGQVTAVWTLYSPVAGYFTEAVQRLYQQLAGDISFALQNLANKAEKEKLAKDLEISTKRWQFAVEASGEGLWDWNLKTDEVYFSETIASMLGYTLAEWGTTLDAWQTRVHPEDLAAAKEAIAAHFRGESAVYECEHRMLCKDGSYRWILDRGSIIERSKTGEPLRMIGLHRDITAEREIKLATQERNESLQAIISESPLGIAIVSTETGKIISTNPAFCTLLARSDAELRSTIWQSFTYPEDIEANEAKNREIMSGRLSGYVMEKRFIRPDKTIIWARLTVRSLRHYRAAENVHLALVEDITDRVEREDRLRALFAEAPLGIAVIDSDTAQVLSANGKFCEIAGRDEAELMRLTWKDFTHPEDIAGDQAFMDEIVSGKRKGFNMVKRYLTGSGGVVWVNMTIAKLSHYHEDRRVHICMVEDITDRIESEKRMRLDAAVISHTRDGVVITTLEPKIVSVNQAYCDITGYSADEVVGKNPSILQSGRQDRDFYAAMWREIKSKGRWQGELYNRRKNGEIYPQISTIDTIYNADGKPEYYVGVFSDISKLKDSEESFERLAHYDVLTGLPNRLMVTNRLAHAVASAGRHRRMVAVLFMDLDHFKNVNDSLGHVAGDELLAAVAMRLKARLRAEDTIARLGGDEFIVLLEDIESAEHAALVARDLLSNLSAPFELASEHEIYSGGSIGISIYPQDGENPHELIRNADAAMYLAKSEGRNTFRFYTQSLTDAARKRLALEAALRRALERGELYVKYQPIVDIASGAIVGAEALCRWRTAEGEEISPADFIPVAESTGLIVQVGDFVARTALAVARTWAANQATFKTMAVNFSVRQFQSHDWYERFSHILRESGVAADRVEVEITESDIMQKSEEGIEVIRELHSSGVRIAIDDFGTGYSSLSYLQRFSVNKMKIDQSFVRDLPESAAPISAC
ncbi:bifunctional diguanylate cyclase/phosphodiesterase [Turneriella parva]|uniref:Diguanylate cyclase/phosphodiesterase with PAS/PAC sensor(S) n=1 Tax=Turneriella parva (strain ATCC BAA-1111 / DSM 21527 / NCTC 11395 / H) TaxID=869212 RepID=I4B517_TURPD|nr:PAS domain S-box protein [Turneriella parva]AFM12374.1 diguanylate cyclase/phosphodiesterase with PAS/PAC sensor(s) [Turneriella parva DSM 21527]